MQKTICKVVYDTETATVEKKFTFGMPGEATGYEETLYKTADGKYFVYTNGGAQSKYPTEDISRIAKDKVADWVKSH